MSELKHRHWRPRPEARRRSLGGPSRRATIAGIIGGVALASFVSTASANGRFPRAQRLIQDATSPELMALYGTYGLLVTRDAGATWRHICEGVTGTYAGEDPLLEIMAGQRVVLRSDAGLSRSDASLCGYDRVLGSAADALQDITRDSASPDGILALSTALREDGVFVSSLLASSDGGATFAPLGSLAPDVIERGLTLDVAASQPELIYVTGLDPDGRGKLARSTDRGQSFVGVEIPGLGVSAPPYIAAISALDPDRVFVRTDVFERADNDFEARETASDSLYFTPDGGATWHEVLHQRGKLYGFALSPDEQWVLAGFGDPVLPAIFVEPSEIGLYRVALADLVASPDAPPWERIYDRGITCLRWTNDGLFACVAQDENGFELGRAPDAGFSLADAAPFAPLLRLPEVLPLECPAESAGAACSTDAVTGWQATCSVLRAQCSLAPAGGAAGVAGQPGSSAPGAGGTSGATPAPASPSSGVGGAPAGGGVGPGGAASGSNAGADGSGQPGAGAPANDAGSCAVSARGGAGAAGGPWAAWAAWLSGLLAVALRRRVRRCARRRATSEQAARAARTRPQNAAQPGTPGQRQAARHSALLALLLALAASSSSGCGDGAPADGPSSAASADGDRGTAPQREPVDCGGAGEDFALGMSKTSPSGSLSVAIEGAEPAPPLVGPNSWIVELSGASGEAVTGADVSLSGWMPQHGHGLSSVPLVEELGGGRYEIRPINLFMPQLWEFDVGVARSDERDIITFSFCVR